MRSLAILFLLTANCVFAQTDTLTIVSYNLLNFPEGRDDCGTNIVVPNRADTLRKILQYAKPDIFVACEIQTSAGADSILNRSLNIFGATNYAQATFHLNGSGGDLQNSLFYNTDKLTLQWQDIIPTYVRDIDHYVLYVNDPNLGVFYDTTFIEVYMCHLKAGSGAAEQATRAEQTQLIMDYIATRPTDRNHFVCGDMNVYSSSETGYQQFISGQSALEDPINMPGNWNNNASFASVHTQSTRTNASYDCGSTGGTDDRFDHILVSSNVITGSDSLKYLAGTYASIGNDGNHFNTNLLAAPVNSLYPDSVVRALYYMSDHLPVTLKTVITYPTSNGLALYPVISGASCNGASDGEATIVANDGQPPYTYLWDNNTGNQPTATATNLPSGSYCVQVTDALGETDDYCMYIPQPAALSYGTFLTPDSDNCNGIAHIVLNGGFPPYNVNWNDSQSQTGQSAYNLCAGTYEATVVDASGCVTVIEIIIQLAGIKEIENDLFTLYPNPAKDVILLKFANEQIGTLKIQDSFGRILREISLQEIGELNSVDLKGLVAGVYFILFENETNQSVQSFVKVDP